MQEQAEELPGRDLDPRARGKVIAERLAVRSLKGTMIERSPSSRTPQSKAGFPAKRRRSSPLIARMSGATTAGSSGARVSGADTPRATAVLGQYTRAAAGEAR